jgi:hypothetical protein
MKTMEVQTMNVAEISICMNQETMYICKHEDEFDVAVWFPT